MRCLLFARLARHRPAYTGRKQSTTSLQLSSGKNALRCVSSTTTFSETFQLCVPRVHNNQRNSFTFTKRLRVTDAVECLLAVVAGLFRRFTQRAEQHSLLQIRGVDVASGPGTTPEQRENSVRIVRKKSVRTASEKPVRTAAVTAASG